MRFTVMEIANNLVFTRTIFPAYCGSESSVSPFKAIISCFSCSIKGIKQAEIGVILEAEIFRNLSSIFLTNSLFHHSCRFDHLWQKHFAGTKQISDNGHALHQWPFNYVQWPGVRFLITSCNFGVLFHVFINALLMKLIF